MAGCGAARSFQRDDHGSEYRSAPSDPSSRNVNQANGNAPASTTPATGGGGTPTPPPGESADADMARQLEALISGPTSPTASGQDVILEGARIHYRLSWLAPMLYGQNPRYGIMWRIDRMADSGTRSRVETFGPGPLWGITGPLHGPGRYEIRADVVTRQPFERLGGFGSTSVVSATRTLQVMSATDIGERALQTYVSSGGPPNYAAFVADLDQQIADLQTTLATGSVTPGAISSQIDQLRDIRGRLLTEMGSTGASPFPSDGNFVQGTTYAAPLSAVMVHPSHAGAVPMSIYLRVWHASGNWQCRLERHHIGRNRSAGLGWLGGGGDSRGHRGAEKPQRISPGRLPILFAAIRRDEH